MAQVKLQNSKIPRTRSKKRIRLSVQRFESSDGRRVFVPLGQTFTILDGHQRLLALRRLMIETSSSIDRESVNESVDEDQD